MIHRITPRSDSSKTHMRAVRPKPSPADLLPVWTAGVFEVSRFWCMKFLGVLWGLRLRQTEQKLALASLSMLLPPLPERLHFAVHLAMPNAKLGAEWIASPFS